MYRGRKCWGICEQEENLETDTEPLQGWASDFWGEVVAATETHCTSVIMKKLGFGGAFAGELWALQPLQWQRNLPEGACLWSVRAACCPGDEEISQREPPDELWRRLGLPTRRSACYHMENSTLEEEKSPLALTLQSPSSALYWQSLTSSKGEMYFARSNASVIK